MRSSLLSISALALLAAAPLLPSPASAQYKNGNHILQSCEDGEPPVSNNLQWGLCTGYITGAVDAIIFWSKAGEGTRCIPEGVSVGQLRDVVVQYIRENPDKRHFSAHLLAYAAVVKAFGCKMPVVLPPK